MDGLARGGAGDVDGYTGGERAEIERVAIDVCRFVDGIGPQIPGIARGRIEAVGVVAVAAGQRIVPGIACQPVVAVVAIDDVGRRAAGEPVVPRAAVERVGIIAA